MARLMLENVYFSQCTEFTLLLDYKTCVLDIKIVRLCALIVLDSF